MIYFMHFSIKTAHILSIFIIHFSNILFNGPGKILLYKVFPSNPMQHSFESFVSLQKA